MGSGRSRDWGRRAAARPSRVAALGAAIALAGCGSTASLSHAELVRRANAICRANSQKIAALGRPVDLPSLQRLLNQGIAIEEPAIAELRKLTPPAHDAVAYRDALNLAAQDLSIARQAAQAAGAGNQGRAQQLIARGQALNAQAHAKFALVGAGDCAK